MKRNFIIRNIIISIILITIIAGVSYYFIRENSRKYEVVKVENYNYFVLKQNNLNYILCIVIRYFGGIKLGAGGLVRAYSKSASECLNICNLKTLKKGYKLEIVFDYDKTKLIDYTLNNIDISDKSFEDKITYKFEISNENYDKIKEILNSNCNEISISDNILIEE